MVAVVPQLGTLSIWISLVCERSANTMIRPPSARRLRRVQRRFLRTCDSWLASTRIFGRSVRHPVFQNAAVQHGLTAGETPGCRRPGDAG